MNLECIVKKSQKQLKGDLEKELLELGYNVNRNNGFLYAEGSIPVLLVAHLDTVHQQQVKNICYSKDGMIIMSPEGIGGDDRAGVLMILEILKYHNCHVLFCEDEEIGGVGAKQFTKSKIKPDVNYIIELDRHGKNDAVFYDCDNPQFTEFVCEFGFEKAYGSFSDISVIAPYLEVAAVNISAGYYNEHRRFEYINLEEMYNNIERVIQIIERSTVKYKYIKKVVEDSLFDFSFINDVSNYYGFNKKKDKEKKVILSLMPLSDVTYLLHNNKIIEFSKSYMIDDKGNIYDYIEELDAAVVLEDTTAHSYKNEPVKFMASMSRKITIIDIDTAWENMWLTGKIS